MNAKPPGRRDDPTLERRLDHQLMLGLVFGALLFAGFPLYASREPERRARAAREQHETYLRLGRDQYQLHCASCHGAEGSGGGPAPTLRAQELLGAVSDTQLRWLIAGGQPGTAMAPYHIDFGGPFTDQHIEQVVTYLRSLEAEAPSVPGWKTGAPAPPRPDHTPVATVRSSLPSPAAPDTAPSAPAVVSGNTPVADATADELAQVKIAPLYAQYCAACHGANGQGMPNLGSALFTAEYRARRADSTIARLIADGVPGKAMVAFSKARGGPLTPAQIAALVAAIRRGRLTN
jgi:mono/diheme cytochrome c family protein